MSIELLIARDNTSDANYFAERGFITRTGELTPYGVEVADLLGRIEGLSTRGADIALNTWYGTELGAVMSCQYGIMVRSQWGYGHRCDNTSDVLDTLKAYRRAKRLDDLGTEREFLEYISCDEGNLNEEVYFQIRGIEIALRGYFNVFGKTPELSDANVRQALISACPDQVWKFDRHRGVWINQMSGVSMRRLDNKSAVKQVETGLALATVFNINEHVVVLAKVTVIADEELTAYRPPKGKFRTANDVFEGLIAPEPDPDAVRIFWESY